MRTIRSRPVKKLLTLNTLAKVKDGGSTIELSI